LNDYLDGTLDAELCREIEAHIGHCANCRIMVDTMRRTVTLCRDGRVEPFPPELEGKLQNLLRARWEKKFGRA
jgi:predicted anti-sigma-YlaC factor YlaD